MAKGASESPIGLVHVGVTYGKGVLDMFHPHSAVTVVFGEGGVITRVDVVRDGVTIALYPGYTFAFLEFTPDPVVTVAAS